MNYLLAFLAGIVQGLTEFLPISSTGHLIIFEKIFNLDPDSFGLAFDASIHLGTLLAVLAFFAKDYLEIFKFKNNLLPNIILGTVPAALAGIVLESYVESVFRQIWVVGASLIFFSFVFIAAEKLGSMNKQKEQISKLGALLVGTFQALALVPGISRSGATISAGLFLGLKREEAARFAFMLSGPIIAAAGGKKFLDVLTGGGLTSDSLIYVVIGTISSGIFGYLTIKYFLKYLSKSNLYPFVTYRLIVGFLLILLSITVWK